MISCVGSDQVGSGLLGNIGHSVLHRLYVLVHVSQVQLMSVTVVSLL